MKIAHFSCAFPVNNSKNFNVETSSAADDESPPPTGTFVLITASNPSTANP